MTERRTERIRDADHREERRRPSLPPARFGAAGVCLVALVLAALRPPAGVAADGLVANPDLDLEVAGLRIAIGGVGLDEPVLPGEPHAGTRLTRPGHATSLKPGAPGSKNPRVDRRGTIEVEIDGPVLDARLYWAGVGRPFGVQEMRFAGASFDGELIGGAGDHRQALAYVAEVTSVVQEAFTLNGAGAFAFDVEDPSPDDNLEQLHGAGLLVVYQDETDPTLMRMLLFDGIDEATSHATRSELRQTDPVEFMFAPEGVPRDAELFVMGGGAADDRADRILVSDNPTIIDELDSSQGEQWDADRFPIVIPAGVDSIRVEIRVPPEPPEHRTSDTVRWTLAALCLPSAQTCRGRAGSLVWSDDDRDGCQDPDEPGLDGVRLVLHRALEEGGWETVGETVTRDQGQYAFDELCAGRYRIEVDADTLGHGYTETLPDACTDGRDSDRRDGILEFVLPDGDTDDPTIDCGFSPPLPERSHAGWNHLDNEITLTGNEPAYWSALSGLPKGVSPWTVLDPGDPPGRPDPEGSTDRILRGFVVLWAIDPTTGEEIRWNHLAGTATIVDYQNGTAWEYTTAAFRTIGDGAAHGETTGTPGILFMNGMEFETGFSELLINFESVEPENADDEDGMRVDTDLTLHPAPLDFRPETGRPLTTLLTFDIWNENEFKFTGLRRCITCWDETRLSRYDNPNHFLRENLQTDRGKARIDGVASDACADSVEASLLGVIATIRRFDGRPNIVSSGSILTGMGREGVAIAYDVHGPPPERPSTGDRVDATQKGSVLYFSKVEVRWDADGNVVQDTFLHLTNDYPEHVRVKLFFVNGDPPTP